MARTTNRLTVKQLPGLGVGLHADGGGLYLSKNAKGAASWVYVWIRAGKRREMGLGPAFGVEAVGLGEARDKAAAARAVVQEGGDPIAERQIVREAERAIPKFGDFATAHIEAKEGGWRNEKHRQQWRNTLKAYAAPIAEIRVDRIGTEHVLTVLKPIWATKAETASRVRGRIEAVLDAAKARGFRSGENPARWRGHLDQMLSKPVKLARGHHAAIPYGELPVVLARLREKDSVSAWAFEFLALTAARTSEVRLATWDEIDLEAKTWTIPAARMKAGRVHRVPLSQPALSVLTKAQRLRALAAPSGKMGSQPVFPGPKGVGLSQMAIAMHMRRLGRTETVHGLRSAFRDWSAEQTSTPREIAEAALAHTVGNTTEAAYFRSDLFDKRRDLMEAWGTFLGGRG